MKGATDLMERMEELRMTLGRVTPSKRLASVHVGSLPKISHEHCAIEWDRAAGAFVLELLSPNGLQIGAFPPAPLATYSTPGTRVVLPNPCQIVIQTIPLFFQCFYVSDEEPAVAEPVKDEEPALTSPVVRKSARRRPSANRPTVVVDSSEIVAYQEMAQEALTVLGGKGTLKKIVDHITKVHPDVVQKKAWRSSIAATLSSSHSLFRSEPVIYSTGKRARYSHWVLRSMVEGEVLEEIEESSGSVPGFSSPPMPSSGQPDSDNEQLQIDEDSDEEALRIDDEEM